MAFRRLAGISGLIIVSMIIASFFLGGFPPGIGDPTGEVVDYYQDNFALQVGRVVDQFSGVFFAIFGAGLVASIWRAERGTGRAWGIVGLIGLIGISTGVGLSVAAHEVLILNSGALEADQLTRSLYDSNALGFTFAMYEMGTFLLGAGAGILMTRVLPRSLGWLALLGAALGFASAAGHIDRDLLQTVTINAGGAAFVVFLAFIALAGLEMVRTREHSEARSPLRTPGGPGGQANGIDT